ncbi:MAG TPA: hypothetical protein PKE26_01620 [Kiritimatiellia bacterium]|nr:hypothetical protein [Kiritimatiellia bacterium]HMO97788.1 hypothetical protein [Kiritimatiellia bacterium]
MAYPAGWEYDAESNYFCVPGDLANWVFMGRDKEWVSSAICSTDYATYDWSSNTELTYIKRWPTQEMQIVILEFPNLRIYDKVVFGAVAPDDPSVITYRGQTGFWHNGNISFIVPIMTEVEFTVTEAYFNWPSYSWPLKNIGGWDTGHAWGKFMMFRPNISNSILSVQLLVNGTDIQHDDYVVKQKPSGTRATPTNSPAGETDNRIPLRVRMQGPTEGFSCKVLLSHSGGGDLLIKTFDGSDYPEDGLSITVGEDLDLWLYGVTPSTALNDVIIEARTDLSGDLICGREDLTVIWISEEDISFRGSDYQGDPLTVGNSAQFSELASWLNNVVGVQIYTPSTGPVFDGVVGQMEMRYRISPNEVLSDVEWSIEREVSRSYWLLENGPFLKPVNGIGWASDTGGGPDRDLIQDEEAKDLFQIDLPGNAQIANLGGASSDRYIYKGKLREWAEVKIGDYWYVCSSDKYWHAILYATYNPSISRWQQDSTRTSQVLPGIGPLSGNPADWTKD